MCMTFCVHETAVTVQHHRKFLILHSHHSAQRDALKDVYYGLIIFVSFLFLFLKVWKFSLKIFIEIFIENFHWKFSISLEFYMKDFKSTKNTSKCPLTGYRPLSRASNDSIIIFSFFIFFLCFLFWLNRWRE